MTEIKANGRIANNPCYGCGRILMLKVVIFDRDKMYKDDYPGPEEFYTYEIHTDISGFLRFIDVKDYRDLWYNLEYFFIDIYPVEVRNDA